MIEILNDNSVSKELGLSFDAKYIKSIDGEEVFDIFDVFYHSTKDKVVVEFLSSDGKSKKIKIDAELIDMMEYEPIKPKKCGCKCIFCFIDQLPKGLRKTLYHKDEDYRFSYLYGNYITLANVKKNDIERIIKYKLSPLYISVHATDENIRKQMLGRKNLPPIIDILKKLASGGIKFHCQIVLCSGINDGEILRKTIHDLSSLYPSVESVAVVPVGLTRFREGLFNLKRVTKECAEQVYNLVAKLQPAFIKDFNTPFVYLSDEFYVLLKKDVPNASFYKGFPQYENGVGIIRKFIDNAKRLLSRDLVSFKKDLRIGLITGEISYNIIRPYVESLARKLQLRLELIPVKNLFFGDSVNVTGLVVGQDIINTIRPKKYDILLIPNVMLRNKENSFLDDLTLTDISSKLDTKVYEFEPTLSGLYKKIKEIMKGLGEL